MPPLRPPRRSNRGPAHTPFRRMTQPKHRLEASPRNRASNPRLEASQPARSFAWCLPRQTGSTNHFLPRLATFFSLHASGPRNPAPRRFSPPLPSPYHSSHQPRRKSHHDHARSFQPLARAGPLFYCPASGISRWPLHSAPSNSKSSSSPACFYFSLPHFLLFSFLQSLARASLDCFTSAAAPA